MKCPEVVEWMHRYLDYDLSEEETVQLYDHLKQCPECAETFRMLKSLSRDLEDLPQVTPKFSIVDAIMPQLDAIDQARQEKSASLEEPPAEMVPVPARPVRTSKFRNSVAGRTAMGAVAAVIILGVAIYSYTPKHLSTAEEPAFKAEKTVADTAASSSEATNGSGGVEQNVEQKSSESIIGESNQQDMADGASLKTGNEELTPQNHSSDAATKQQPAKPTEQPASKPEDKAVTRSTASESTKQAPDQGKSDTGTPAKTSSTDQTDPADSGNSQDKAAADNSNTTETPPSDPKKSDQDPALKDDFQSMGITTLKPNPLQLNSPDGKYAATVDENKLTIYSVSDKDGQKTAVKTIDLPGTWVSGVWSADSTVFTYQMTDDQGTTSSKTYQVNGSDSSNP
ncbi:hypothetical protein GRF59_17025 [Paenibacillus sp. HJL G12]|uniref:Anti-sigma-W factor RsiW n=1 Tax=Paenibacillus dendrobii TaxID=2691084 RepID=A0A7X3IKW0_9BACL|nr:zf-HC2 domain-containing protein [Paenibacillus dendrobii]MWV45326.1 hypothetical protein [Paenibacillus dendrobii]